jgi:hypothetical protein
LTERLAEDGPAADDRQRKILIDFLMSFWIDYCNSLSKTTFNSKAREFLLQLKTGTTQA